MRTFEIFFKDLTPEAQARIMECFHTTEREENWDVFPLSVIEREEDEVD